MASGGNRWQNFFEESKSPHNTPHNKLFKTVAIAGNQWQSVAELFLVVSVDLSDFGSYWQHLNTKDNGEGVIPIRGKKNGTERVGNS